MNATSLKGTGRYVLTDTVLHGPNMIDVNRFRSRSDGTRFTGATLDEVLCIMCWEQRDDG
jgi:hypothetical protein